MNSLSPSISNGRRYRLIGSLLALRHWIASSTELNTSQRCFLPHENNDAPAATTPRPAIESHIRDRIYPAKRTTPVKMSVRAASIAGIPLDRFRRGACVLTLSLPRLDDSFA